jgi:hypothetical protein
LRRLRSALRVNSGCRKAIKSRDKDSGVDIHSDAEILYPRSQVVMVEARRRAQSERKPAGVPAQKLTKYWNLPTANPPQTLRAHPFALFANGWEPPRLRHPNRPSSISVLGQALREERRTRPPPACRHPPHAKRR